MNIVEILQRDHDRNHADSENFLVSVEEILEKTVEGYRLAKKRNTVILHKPVGGLGEGIEFHCYNAGTGLELATNVLEFFEDCRQAGATWAITPYENPVINKLFEMSIPADRLTIVKTERGFEATTRL
jgi:hypothetical protein